MYYEKLIEDSRNLLVIITLGLELLYIETNVLFQINQLNKSLISFILILSSNCYMWHQLFCDEGQLG